MRSRAIRSSAASGRTAVETRLVPARWPPFPGLPVRRCYSRRRAANARKGDLVVEVRIERREVAGKLPHLVKDVLRVRLSEEVRDLRRLELGEHCTSPF